MRFLSGAIIFFLAVGTAQAQTLFRADLDGAQETPPTATNAAGYARLTLNPDDSVTYEVRTWLVTGTAAHVHTGAAGVAGPILFPLSGGPSIWSGTSAPLAAGDKTALRTHGLYVNVHSTAFPGGEIRGQIEPKAILYGAHLTGDQETPPNGSAAVGDGVFTVNPDNSITYSVSTSGITATAAHIHTGAFGVAGGILFGLSGGPTSWSGTTPAMSATDFNNLQANGLYVNVHSGAFPGGEIRSQLTSTDEPYGSGCASSAGVPTLNASGSAYRGGVIVLNIAGGVPSGSGLWFFSLSDGVATSGLCPYLLGGPILILPIFLDPAGNFAVKGVIPNLSGSINIYSQFFGLEPGGPSGDVYASNGLELSLFDY